MTSVCVVFTNGDLISRHFVPGDRESITVGSD